MQVEKQLSEENRQIDEKSIDVRTSRQINYNIGKPDRFFEISTIKSSQQC